MQAHTAIYFRGMVWAQEKISCKVKGTLFSKAITVYQQNSVMESVVAQNPCIILSNVV